MIWLLRLYLLFMGFVYLLIGAWAIVDPVLGAFETGIPSFSGIVGLNVANELGYSEMAGLYGGLNFWIGVMCLIGIFKESVGIFATKFLTFLVGAIASGRVMFSLIPSTPGFYNSFFVFEVCAFFIGLGFLLYFRNLDKTSQT